MSLILRNIGFNYEFDTKNAVADDWLAAYDRTKREPVVLTQQILHSHNYIDFNYLRGLGSGNTEIPKFPTQNDNEVFVFTLY